MKKKKKTKYIRGSFATRKDSDGYNTTYIPDLARVLTNWSDMPKVLTDTRAQEISFLAKAYLKLRFK